MESRGSQADVAAMAVTYAASHGIVVSVKDEATIGARLSHAPLTAFPSSIDSSCYEQAIRLTVPLNKMVAAIAADRAYLKSALMETAEADADFTGRLMDLLEVAPAESTGVEISLCRYDYFLHEPRPGRVELKMVEMNCIASSFASLGTLTSQMHRHLGGHPVCRDFKLDVSKMPENDALSGLAHGLASAHATFVRTLKSPASTQDTWTIMVVQPGEHNVFDQELLRTKLWDAHGVYMKRFSLAEIAKYGSLDDEGRLIMSCDSGSSFTVSVVYFRAGYTPTDYPSEAEWDARKVMERSCAAKCPSVAVQLVGTKKIQQLLDTPGEVERFVPDLNEANLIRASFARQYSLAAGEKGDQVANMAIENSGDYVLKPQREGGGNNLYSEEMKSALLSMPPEERAGYVLMERLRPKVVRNVVVRNGAWQEAEVVSEFGVYGVHVAHDGLHVDNMIGGTLLRSKMADQDDGGVAAGVAVLDSVLLS